MGQGAGLAIAGDLLVHGMPAMLSRTPTASGTSATAGPRRSRFHWLAGRGSGRLDADHNATSQSDAAALVAVTGLDPSSQTTITVD